jgi:hypothetical protein
MTSPKIPDQKYALPASPESTMSRDNAIRMMDKLNRTGYMAHLGKPGTSGPSSVDEYSDTDSLTSEEEASMNKEMSKEYSESNSSIGVPESKRTHKEFLRRQKETNMHYNKMTPSVQKLFRDPRNKMVDTTLKKGGIDVNFLQNLAKQCRKSKDEHLVRKVHTKIHNKGYPQEWASDMIRICAVDEDTLLKEISDQAIGIEECVEKLNRSLNKLWEYKNSRKFV